MIQCVLKIEITGEGTSANDQDSFERIGNARFPAESYGVAALNLRYALDFWSVSVVKLGLFVFGHVTVLFVISRFALTMR